MHPSSLGSLVTPILLRSNMSRAELARRLKVSRVHISAILRGDARPSPALCNAIADELRLPSEQVLTAAGIIGEFLSEHDISVQELNRLVAVLGQDDLDDLLVLARHKASKSPRGLPKKP